MKRIYAVVDNNHEEKERYTEWVDGIYSTPERALAGLLKCEQKYLATLKENYASAIPEETLLKWHKNNLADTPVEIRIYKLNHSDGLIEYMLKHQDTTNNQ